MAHSRYDSDVVDVLDAAAIGLTRNTNLWPGKARAAVPGTVPIESVWVMETGGPEPINYCDGATTPQLREPTVQIMVRGDPRDWHGGRVLADAVWDAIHDNPPAGYIAARCMQPTPLVLGEDENGNPLWSVNVRLIISE